MGKMEKIEKDKMAIAAMLKRHGYDPYPSDKPRIIVGDFNGHAVEVDLSTDPDDEEMIDFYVSADWRMEGRLACYNVGYPEDEEFYLMEAVRGAFEDDKKFRQEWQEGRYERN